MIRQIIKIDDEKCTGCGICVSACHEGAIGLVNGKARLLRDDYCDGLGDCLPVCPTGAITFDECEALPYNEEAVKEKMKQPQSLPCGCPGTNTKEIKSENTGVCDCRTEPERICQTHLNQWPVQIKLVPSNAPYLKMQTC